MRMRLLTAALLFLFPALSFAQETRTLPDPVPYTIVRASSPITIDAVLDEAAWAGASVLPIPYEWLPGDNVPAPVDTDVRLTFDDDHLYISAVAHDSDPKAIRAHLSDRDQGFQDDHLVFLIDPFNDERRAFQFRVTALGVQMDAVFSQNEGFEDFSWDTIWNSAGRITEDGFTVEIAIPFKSLRFPKTTGVQTWGFIAERSWPRSSRHRMTSAARDRNNNCLLCRANKVTGFQAISPGRDIELDPTLTMHRTDRRADFPAGDLKEEETKAEPGLTGRWGVTPNMTLNATVNPDFSQVEADAAQLDVNTRFALFFPEKRPFFLEGADFFELPRSLVFTRTVADPIAGAKLTGKAGRNAIGLFVTRDRVNNLVLPGSQESDQASLDDDVTTAVARWRRDVGQASTVGVLYTGREADGYHNRLGAVDGFLRLSETQQAQFLYARSFTRYPDTPAGPPFPEEAIDGGAFFGRWDLETRNWGAEVTYRDLRDDFRADAGFIPQVGLRGPEVELTRRFWSDGRPWFNSIEVEVEAQQFEEYDGALVDRKRSASLTYQGPWQTVVQLEAIGRRNAFADRLFDLKLGSLYAEARPSGGVYGFLFVSAGDEIDTDNVRKADLVELNPGLELKIGRPLIVSGNHLYQRLSLGGEEIFTANLAQARVLYHFSTRAFVRAILQYRTIHRNPGQFQEPVNTDSDRLFSQLLFSYKVNPQTVLFAGYTDTRLGAADYDLTLAGRTFFLKLGYAWRL